MDVPTVAEVATEGVLVVALDTKPEFVGATIVATLLRAWCFGWTGLHLEKPVHD
jgi:hypothetical protein